jgi:plastocyanin
MREGLFKRARLLVAAAALASLAAPSHATSVPASFVVVTEYYSFVPGDTARPTIDLTITRGSSLTLVNIDPVGGLHSMTAEALKPDGKPLFDSAVIDNPGQTAVHGVESLAPGTYRFHCSVHRFVPMQGVMQVID